MLEEEKQTQVALRDRHGESETERESGGEKKKRKEALSREVEDW